MWQFSSASVLGEDGWRRESNFGAGVAQEFFPREVHFGPAGGTHTDDSAGADAFDDEVGLKTDLDATAAQRHLSVRLRDI